MTILYPGDGLVERLVLLPDGRTMRAVLAGDSDGPLVVLEAGMSLPAASWVHSQRKLAAHARTLSYDRAGNGGSDDDPQARTLERIVDDLTAMLDALGENQPMLLVGHSWGGPILRLFAERHPERVAGLVLLDAAYAEALSVEFAKRMTRTFSLFRFLARIGGAGLIRKYSIRGGPSSAIPSEDLKIVWRDYACARAMRAGVRESQQIITALPTLRRLQEKGTPDVPTVCVVGGLTERGMERMRPIINAAAASHMAQTPRGRFVLVADSGHHIPQEQPGIVNEILVSMLREIAEPTSSSPPAS